MDPTPAFATAATFSRSLTSPFFNSISGAPSRFYPISRPPSRARILALGATPSPPPPEDSAEKGDSPDTQESFEGSENVEEVTADDILSSPAFLKKKLEIVQKELIEAKAKLDEDSEDVKAEKNKYLRLAADYENYRRRSMEDLRKQDAKSTAKVCKEILGVLDNFERAIKAVDAQTEKEKAISSSYQAINKQLLDALVKLKVEPLDAIGEQFDPALHEAIQKMESEEYREDIVCAQYQRGYKIGETLIRPAIVAVSSGPGPEGEEEPEDGNGTVADEEEAIDVDAAENLAEAVKDGEPEKKEGQ